MSASPSASPEALLAHRRFLQPIVRALLRGGDGEDDVVQEALVREWLAGPGAPRAQGSWLARVARNLSFDHLRAARRTERLRQRLSPPDAAPSPDEVLQQEEQRTRVVHAVLSLPQPYRDVVLLRYWEELSPAAIASHLHVPGATVRSQLLRGLAMLRERLDADYGERRAWLVALAPLAKPGLHPFAIGALLMTKTKVAVAGAAVLVAALTAWWMQLEPTVPSSPGGTTASRIASPGVASAPTTPPTAPASTPTATERVAAVPPGELAVRGQVLHKGQPFAGLSLTVHWFDGFEASGAPAATSAIACDGEGRFLWRGPRRETPGTVVVAAPKQPVRLSCAGELVLPEHRDVTLEVSVIPLDRVVFGRVHDHAGAPIAGAHLSVNLWPETATTSDAAGRYEMRVPAPGYPLVAHAPGYRQRLVQAYLPAEALRHEFDVELGPGAQLRGRVVDAGKQPVAAAKVVWAFAADAVETDGEGRFVVDGVADGERTGLTVHKTGFQRAQATGVGGGEAIEVVLQPGLAVVVRAVDANATPITGASVNLVQLPMGGTRVGFTRPDGRITAADLPPRPVEVVVQKAGYVVARRTVDPREQTGELTITLVPGHAIRGQVVDPDGQPVAGASIYCQLGEPKTGPMSLAEMPRSVGSRASADADGRFEITGLPAEPCTLFAHHPDFVRGQLVFVGGAVRETTLRLQRAPTISGIVIDGATGAPIPKFSVALSAPDLRLVAQEPVAFAAADGRFCLRNWELKGGMPVTIVVSAEGYAPARIATEARAAPAPDQNVVRLVAGTRVEGVVRDPATGAPVAGVTVALAIPDPTLRPNDGPATDATGRFALEAVPAGEQRLRLQHAERPEVVFGPFTVPAGASTFAVDPTMGVGVTLRGRVTGAPDAAGLQVTASRADGRAAMATVRDDLTFEVKGLGVGRTSLIIDDRSGRQRIVRLDVGETDVDGFVLSLRPGTGAIRLTVDGATGGFAELRRLDVPVGETASLDSVAWRGTTLVDGLAAGRYRVDVRSEDAKKRGSAEIVVAAGEVPLTIECRAK